MMDPSRWQQIERLRGPARSILLIRVHRFWICGPIVFAACSHTPSLTSISPVLTHFALRLEPIPRPLPA